MKIVWISKTNRMKSIIAIILLVMFLFVGGCTDSPAKIDTLVSEPNVPDTYEPGIITMVTIADEIILRAFGKGEMFVSIEWENVPPDSVVTEWVFTLSEYGSWDTSFTIPVPFPDRSITVNGYITNFDCGYYKSGVYNKLTHLDVSGMPSLIELRTISNYLTELDVSKNTLLEVLECDSNLLNNLDLSNNSALRELRCAVNSLTSLDVSNNKLLTHLYCGTNQLTRLDVSNNLLLETLSCGGYPLDNLDLSHNTSLITLVVGGTQLGNLDLSFNSKLEILWLGGNHLKKLDLSNNTNLEFLWSDREQLEYLDLSYNPKLKILYLDENYLKSLDLSNNRALLVLGIKLNLFDAKALNDIFNALPDISYQTDIILYNGNISIWHNPGEDDCDKSIAEAKGWKFLEKATSYSEQEIDEIKEKYLNYKWRNK